MVHINDHPALFCAQWSCISLSLYTQRQPLPMVEGQKSFPQPGSRIHRMLFEHHYRCFTDDEPSLYETEEPFLTQGGAPFDFGSTEVSFPVSAPAVPQPDLSLFINPVYSSSGFDLLSILSRVATRPNPRVVLGPVDLTCSFVVVDPRRYDHPIVYCSPSFCNLTGYQEQEVIGKNCRFLQAPNGQVSKGDIRRFTSQDAVAHLAKSLIADKECQTSIVNYKKNGDPFINLVTVIPVPVGGDDQGEIIFQVGFQVDLSEQPNAILEKLRDGSYVVDYAQQQQHPPIRYQQSRKPNTIPPVVLSNQLKRLLLDPALLRSLPITTSTTVQLPSSIEDPTITHRLHLLLLEASPDFIHVVSLKGSFLYVAPSVRRVLGYEPDEMVGTCIADYAHPEDVVPLMRELKESSATGLTSAQPPPDHITTSSYSSASSPTPPGSPRSVDLLFRAKTKMGRYVWVECRGRLHVEPGKGRKAIVLSGRTREMMHLKWQDVDLAGGLAMALSVPSTAQVEAEAEGSHQDRSYRDQEFWGMLGGMNTDTIRFLSVGKGVRDVLGWNAEELLGKGLGDIVEQSSQDVLGAAVGELRTYQKDYYARCSGGSYDDLVEPRVRKVRCRLATKTGPALDVWFILYRADPHLRGQIECLHEMGGKGVSLAALVYQIRKVDASVVKCGPGTIAVSSSAPSDQDIFQELDISRGSSWQYELQQLRFANIRLKEELKMLEAAEAAEAQPEVVGREGERFSVYAEVEQQPGGMQQSSLSIHQHRHQHHIRQEHSMQYSLPMPPPLPVLAPQPQMQMQTPDHLLDQQDNLKQHQYFRLLDDQVPPVRSSVGRLMTGSRIGTTRVGIPQQQQTLQCLSQTRTDWRMIPPAPSPSPLAFVHRQYQQQHHQHEHQHHHQHQRHDQSSVQGQGQRQRLKRSWNHMESA